jgi:hypothetical protein
MMLVAVSTVKTVMATAVVVVVVMMLNGDGDK